MTAFGLAHPAIGNLLLTCFDYLTIYLLVFFQEGFDIEFFHH